MFRLLLVTALCLCVVHGFDLHDFLRRIRPGRNRISRPKRPPLFVPLRGKMAWDIKKQRQPPPKTAPSTTLFTTAFITPVTTSFTTATTPATTLFTTAFITPVTTSFTTATTQATTLFTTASPTSDYESFTTTTKPSITPIEEDTTTTPSGTIAVTAASKRTATSTSDDIVLHDTLLLTSPSPETTLKTGQERTGKSYSSLVYTECQKAFLPDFVAILANTSVGQTILERLQIQGLISFNESNVILG